MGSYTLPENLKHDRTLLALKWEECMTLTEKNKFDLWSLRNDHGEENKTSSIIIVTKFQKIGLERLLSDFNWHEYGPSK